MRYCPAAAGGDGKEVEGPSLGGATVHPRPAAPGGHPRGGSGASASRCLCRPPASARYRWPGVSRCLRPLTRTGCPARSGAPRVSSSPSVTVVVAGVGGPGGRGVARRAPAECAPCAGPAPAGCFRAGCCLLSSGWRFFYYYSDFYWYLTAGCVCVCVFVNAAFADAVLWVEESGGIAARGSRRFVRAGSVIVHPSPSQDSHRSRREPCPGHSCPPGDLGRGMQGVGCAAAGSGFPFAALNNDYSDCLHSLCSLPYGPPWCEGKEECHPLRLEKGT